MPKNTLDGSLDDQPVIGETAKKIAEMLDNQKSASLSNTKSGNRAVESRAPRSNRDMETREADLTPQTWRPADVLPDPPQRDGWVHRWVRGSSRGQVDSVNVARAMREGWRPCSASDYPEIALQMFNNGESVDTIEFGGLILCRLPVETANQRNNYYKNLSLAQINSVNQRLREEAEEEGRVRYDNRSRSTVNDIAPFRG